MIKNKKVNIAFNGFGRIGRSLVRKLITDERYNIVAINARINSLINIELCFTYLQ